MIDWHRLLGLALTDLLHESPWRVELEREVAVLQQYLDILIVRRVLGEFTGQLPDGLDNLADHNLLTFKSLHEALVDWTLKELTHHYVAYRKLVSPKDGLLPESLFRLYGISMRFPEKLNEQVGLKLLQPGVYQVVRGTDHIRIIVLHEIPRAPHNSVWHLFSGQPALVQYGAVNYPHPSNEIRSVIDKLRENYKLEGLAMPYTMEQFIHDYVAEKVDVLSMEERLRGVPAEELLRGMPAEERLRGLPAEERVRGLPAEELLRGLPPEALRRHLAGMAYQEVLQFLPEDLVNELKSAGKSKPES